MYAMTNPIKPPTQRSVAVTAPSSWIVPPILIPILLTIMIGIRALYVAYPW
jgi:hypothetical protein